MTATRAPRPIPLSIRAEDLLVAATYEPADADDHAQPEGETDE